MKAFIIFGDSKNVPEASSANHISPGRKDIFFFLQGAQNLLGKTGPLHDLLLNLMANQVFKSAQMVGKKGFF